MGDGGPIVSRTGGADVSFVAASWPFARFEASRRRIAVRVSILGLHYAFAPEDVTALEVDLEGAAAARRSLPTSGDRPGAAR
jgi:hypothetical protein